jgi:hypothetical protein
MIKDLPDEYLLASVYADENGKTVEEVIAAITQGTLEGRAIDGKWHVESEWSRYKREEKQLEAELKRIKSQAKFDREQGLVRVVSVDIPFKDVFVLTFKIAVAGLIIGISALLLLSLLLVVID